MKRVLLLAVLCLVGCSHTLSTQWPLSPEWPAEFHDPMRPPLDPEAARATAAAVDYVASRPYVNLKGCHPDTAFIVTTFKAESLYVVQVDPNEETCPGARMFDWFEVYAVSPDGRVLAKRPEAPAQ